MDIYSVFPTISCTQSTIINIAYSPPHETTTPELQVFPKNTLVITQMRDPLSRILSSYEFALEVGARRLKEDEKQWENSAKDANFVNTMNVWPWSYLVPYFRGEVKKRVCYRSFVLIRCCNPFLVFP